MDKKNQKRIVYVLLLLIVVIAGVAYYYGYMKYVDMAKAAKTEARNIQKRIDVLNEKIAMRPLYEEAIVDAKASIDAVTEKYGPGNTAEKDIMFVRDLELETGGSVSSASFTDDAIAFVSSGTDENGQPTVAAYTSALIVNYEMSYEGLKKAMEYITSYPERMTVETFTTAVNEETGLLTGSITMNLYSMQTADKTYKEPDITNIIIGTDNIFGAYGVPMNGENEQQ